MAVIKGYKCIIVLFEKFSLEKEQILQNFVASYSCALAISFCSIAPNAPQLTGLMNVLLTLYSDNTQLYMH